MKTYAVDFESYYKKRGECSLVHLGTPSYLRHPECDVYLVSIVGEDWEWCGHPDEAPWEKIKGERWLSHNKYFDALVYKHKGYKIEPGEWLCTANMCAALNMPRSLQYAVKEGFGEDISKGVRDQMSGKQWADMTPEFQQDVIKYALDDSRWCLKLYQTFGDKWNPMERAISEETIRMCSRGVPIDKKTLEAGVKHVGKIREETTQALPWVFEGSKAKVLSPKALGIECEKVGITPPKSLARPKPFAKEGNEASKWIEDNPKYPWVEQMQTIRRANTFEKKLAAMLRRTYRGWMPYDLKVYGGHLGRDSGDGGVNMQNLNKAEMMEVDMRGLLKAPKGYKFVNPDLSAIEPRVLAWLTEDQDFLDMLAIYPDVYEAYGRSHNLYDYDDAMVDRDPVLRADIKVRVLGLNYGMGPDRFAAENGLSLREAKKIVYAYREDNPKTIEYGKELERDLAIAARKRRAKHVIEFPGGSTIIYVRPKKHGDLSAETMRDGRLIRGKLYSGLLIENACQHFARQIFMHGVLEMNKKKIFPLLRTHDEVLNLAKTKDAPRILDETIECMTMVPTWAEGMVIAAEGKILDQYQK